MPPLWAAASLACALAAGGCATRITPPGRVDDPVRVFIADYGKHSSLILPAVDGAGADGGGPVYVEYAFGDWRCFVENRNFDNPLEYVRAVLCSDRSGLGRRFLRGYDPHDPDLAAKLDTYRLLAFDADRRRVRRLAAALDRRHRAGGPTTHNPQVRLTFAPDPERYRLFNNCNHRTARWAEWLGCRVRGCALLSNFRLAAPR